MIIIRAFLVIALYLSTINCIAQQKPDTTCVVCERLKLFNKLKTDIGKIYWPKFEQGVNMPLLYFTKNKTYITNTTICPFSLPYTTLACLDRPIFVISRIDDIPFHMENKMNFDDSASDFYYRPMMFCSDVESMVAIVKDFTSTEEWLQLLMHEYFHSFQFKHEHFINYFAKKISIKEDSLDRMYLHQDWFRNALQIENKNLLEAIHACDKDSCLFYIRTFIQKREDRRSAFKNHFLYDLTLFEDFWEKAEGTARYIEYYTALSYKNFQLADTTNCDTLFHHFMNFKNGDLEKEKAFVVRTQIMPAYYYVTGFNMCRLLDRIQIRYKDDLFLNPTKSIYNILKSFSTP